MPVTPSVVFKAGTDRTRSVPLDNGYRQITLPIPQATAPGDFMLAHMVRRSETLPEHEGWTLVFDQRSEIFYEQENNTYIQWLSVFSRSVGDGATSAIFSVHQPNSGIFEGALQVFSSPAPITIIDHAVAFYDSWSSGDEWNMLPRLPYTSPGQLKVASGGFIVAPGTSVLPRVVPRDHWAHVFSQDEGIRVLCAHGLGNHYPDVTIGALMNLNINPIPSSRRGATLASIILGLGAPISGVAKTAQGAPVDTVFVFDWARGTILKQATPDSTGAWQTTIPPIDYGVIYLAEGCAPVTHGPYLPGFGFTP